MTGPNLNSSPTPSSGRWGFHESSDDPRRQLALAEMEMVAERAHDKAASNTDMPEEWWKIIPICLGMPVKVDASECQDTPWVTWGLAAAIALVSVVGFSNVASNAANWGLMPAEPWRHNGLTLLTPVFLHVGWLHLLSNLYFLAAFGGNVEDEIGRGKYAVLLIFASVACCLLQAALAVDRTTPAIGASGVVSGILVFYTLQFPRERLGWFVFRRLRAGWLVYPVWVFLLLWLAIQILGAIVQASAPGAPVAYAGHLGGALAGFIGWILYRVCNR